MAEERPKINIHSLSGMFSLTLNVDKLYNTFINGGLPNLTDLKNTTDDAIPNVRLQTLLQTKLPVTEAYIQP